MPYSLTNDVNQEEKTAADLVVKMAARDLRIEPPTPTVQFFCEDGPIKEALLGYAPPGGQRICIRRGLSPRVLFKTCLHECCHVMEWRSPVWRKRSFAHWERECFLYERSWPSLARNLSYDALTQLLLTTMVAARNAAIEPQARRNNPGAGFGGAYPGIKTTRVYDHSDEWERWRWKPNPDRWKDPEFCEAAAHARQRFRAEGGR